MSLERWADFEGNGIYYAATELEARARGSHGPQVAVIGGANSAVPATSWLEGVVLDRSGFILTDTDLPETQPRLFAVGDVRHGSLKRIAAAVGEGSSAIGLRA